MGTLQFSLDSSKDLEYNNNSGSGGEESAYRAGDLGSNPGWEDPLEKGMAIHSSILAWRIPWTGGAWWGYSPWGNKELDMTE